MAPEPGEDVALAAETLRLQSADDLRLAAQAALAAVAGADDEAGGALTEVTVARKALDRAAADQELAELARRLAETSYLLADVTADLSPVSSTPWTRSRDGWSGSPARRSDLAGLTRKYGTTIDDVIDWSAESAVRLNTLQSSDDRIDLLAARVAELDDQLSKLAAAITAARTVAARARSPTRWSPSSPRWPCRTRDWPSS